MLASYDLDCFQIGLSSLQIYVHIYTTIISQLSSMLLLCGCWSNYIHYQNVCFVTVQHFNIYPC